MLPQFLPSGELRCKPRCPCQPVPSGHLPAGVESGGLAPAHQWGSSTSGLLIFAVRQAVGSGWLRHMGEAGILGTSSQCVRIRKEKRSGNLKIAAKTTQE